MYKNLIKKLKPNDSDQDFSYRGDGGTVPLLAENLLIFFPTRKIPPPQKVHFPPPPPPH